MAADPAETAIAKLQLMLAQTTNKTHERQLRALIGRLTERLASWKARQAAETAAP